MFFSSSCSYNSKNFPKSVMYIFGKRQSSKPIYTYAKLTSYIRTCKVIYVFLLLPIYSYGAVNKPITVEFCSTFTVLYCYSEVSNPG